MKPPLRTKSVGTKVSEAEFALLEERARGAGMRLAEWVREALLAAPVEPVAGSGVDSGEVALGEILALRSLLLNLHFRAAKGEPVAEAEMRGLIERADGTKIERADGTKIERADGTKIERARERMAAVRTAARATAPEPETASETTAETHRRRDRRRAEHGGMGTQGVAEPDAGVDVDGDPADDGVLRRDADGGVRGELDGGGAAVPVGLPCAAHDACYTNAGVGVWDNWNLNLSPDKQAKLQQPESMQCSALNKRRWAWAVNQTFTNVWGVYTCQ
ncbi:MAG: hypothetical protein HIU93_15200 [Acidobacteria bacterium]|nr:hypothetical protein [Acidobacteriota bacterium]